MMITTTITTSLTMIVIMRNQFKEVRNKFQILGGKVMMMIMMMRMMMALNAHLAKLCVFYRKSIVLAAPGGQSACFLEGFGTTGGTPGQSDLE